MDTPLASAIVAVAGVGDNVPICHISGRRSALKIDDGIGAYLVDLGMAKSFLVNAEWEE